MPLLPSICLFVCYTIYLGVTGYYVNERFLFFPKSSGEYYVSHQNIHGRANKELRDPQVEGTRSTERSSSLERSGSSFS